METLRTLTTEIVNDGVSYRGVVAYNHEWAHRFGQRHVVVLREPDGKPRVHSVLFEQRGHVNKEIISSCGRDTYDWREVTVEHEEGSGEVRFTTFKVNVSAKPKKMIKPEFLFSIHELFH
jgi:hypothetical protein